MDLHTLGRRVILPVGEPGLCAVYVERLRAGTFDGTVRGTRVIGRVGIAAMTGLQVASLRRHVNAGVRSLPEPLFYVDHHGAVVHLYDLEAVTRWAVQLGKLRGPR